MAISRAETKLVMHRTRIAVATTAKTQGIRRTTLSAAAPRAKSETMTATEQRGTSGAAKTAATAAAPVPVAIAATIATAMIATAMTGTATIGTATIGTATPATAMTGTAMTATAMIATAMSGAAMIAAAPTATTTTAGPAHLLAASERDSRNPPLYVQHTHKTNPFAPRPVFFHPLTCFISSFPPLHLDFISGARSAYSGVHATGPQVH